MNVQARLQLTGRAWEYVANKKIELGWTKEARKTQKKYEKLKNNEKLLLVKDSSPFYKIYKKDREGYIVWN